jgi:hypothetical protein
MSGNVIEFVVLCGEFQQRVAELAGLHAAFDRSRRRVVIDDGTISARFGPDVLAVMLKPDGSISDLLSCMEALSEARIEDAFVCAALVTPIRSEHW